MNSYVNAHLFEIYLLPQDMKSKPMRYLHEMKTKVMIYMKSKPLKDLDAMKTKVMIYLHVMKTMVMI
jgi:hypothetical protein